MSQISISEVNAFNEDEFTSNFGAIFEHSPWVAERSFPLRPFASAEDLHAAMCEVFREATHAEQLALIRAHPDLGDRLGGLTAESTKEQEAAGLDALTPAEVETFNASNLAYKTKFGFPFILCARLNDKSTMLAAFEARLQNAADVEFETALGEIENIARLRILGIVADS